MTEPEGLSTFSWLRGRQPNANRIVGPADSAC
jgi:hypothetical protein